MADYQLEILDLSGRIGEIGYLNLGWVWYAAYGA